MGSKKHHKSGKIYANDPCVCGSGKKYKRCCTDKDTQVRGKSLYETMVEGFNKGELVSFQRVTGDKGSMEISSQSVTSGKETYSHDKPVKISVGDSEDGNSSGQAVNTISMNSQNKIRTIQIGSGRVSFKDSANYKIGIKNKIDKIVDDDWRVQVRVHTQSEEPREYFDLVLINRKRERNHITDPHVTFRPDGSGKYIRFGAYSDKSEIKTLSGGGIGGILLPSSTEVRFVDITITINYLFEEGVLYIDKVEVK